MLIAASGIVLAVLVIERWEEIMSEENSTGSNLIWSWAMIIIVGIIAATLYYSGFLSPKKKQDIDVEIKVPAASNTR